MVVIMLAGAALSLVMNNIAAAAILFPAIPAWPAGTGSVRHGY